MKSLVIYYSHYGNTAFVTHKAWAKLSTKGEAEMFEVEYVGMGKNLISRIFYRIFPTLVRMKPVPVDLKSYDVLFLGVPVLGAHPSSVLLKYVKSLKNTVNKKIVCCYVYGMELSAKYCAARLAKVLRKNGNPQITSIFIPWTHVHNESFLEKTLIEPISNLN